MSTAEDNLNVRVFPMSSSGYTSQIYAGLFDLAAENKIRLEFIWRPRTRIHERNPRRVDVYNTHTMYLEVAHGARVARICFDLSDGPNIASVDGLEKCDVYFKRSHWAEVHGRFRCKEKILPYGLNFPSASVHESHVLIRALIQHAVAGAWKGGLTKSLRAVRRALIASLRRGNAANEFRVPSADIEYPPDQPAEPLILFQTRLFDPTYVNDPDLVVEINEFRIATMRALKSAFGDRLVGGFIPNSYAAAQYPEVEDLLTLEPTGRTEYLNVVRRCAIGIFTRGLGNSNGWRLPEFLAASRCIVSQRLKYGLPAPLEDHEHCLFFDTPAQAVSACERLLENPVLMKKMRENNFAFYRDHVRPASIVLNSIRTALREVRA